MARSLIFVVVAALTFLRAQSQLNQRLRVVVIKHQHCSGGFNEHIRFPDSSDAEIVEDPSQGYGCYKLQGSVKVIKEFGGRGKKLQLHTTTQSSGIKAPADECRNANATTGCGGVGSCVYCDVCDKLSELGQASAVNLRVNSEALDCDKPLKPGTYDNVALTFCMPTKKQMMEYFGVDSQFFDQYLRNGLTTFQTIRIFDTPINKLSKQAVADLIAKGDNVVACHKVAANIYA